MKTLCGKCSREIPPGEVCGCDGFEAMSVDQLKAQMKEVSLTVRKVFIQMGRIYYWIKRKLIEEGVYTPKDRYGGWSMRSFFIENGLTASMASHAAIGAAGYARVVAGRMAEEQYETLSMEACLRIKHEDEGKSAQPFRERKPIMTPARTRIPIRNQLPELAKVTHEDTPRGNPEDYGKARDMAQQWPLVAREQMPGGAPGQWDRLISESLSPIGRLRYELQHADAKMLLGKDPLEMPAFLK